MANMIFTSPTDLVFDDVFLKLANIVLPPVYLKLEGFSITGSIKIKAAKHMIEALERTGELKSGRSLIESSSGNLGLALSMVCAAKGYDFTCVTDPNISPQTASLIAAYGAKLITVTKRDGNGGFLGTRIDLIMDMLSKDKELIWVNQYENSNNVHAHYCTTGPSILSQFNNLDYLFVGAGTTGTLGGVSRYFRDHSPRTRIIGVDTQGSITFGFPSGKRYIPGLGTSRPPPIRHFSYYDDMIMVKEDETIAMCQGLARSGILLGGSSGTVLVAVTKYGREIPASASVVAISPDLGDRYVDTIYDSAWVGERFQTLRDHQPTQHAAIESTMEV